MLRIKIAMKKMILRRKRKFKREIREETKRNISRKVSTQGKIVHHQMRMMIVTMIQKEYSSWSVEDDEEDYEEEGRS
jgi:hypothetical protein